MQIIKKFYSKTILSVVLLGLAGMTFANDNSTENLNISTASMNVLLKEAGGLGYVERNAAQNTSKDKLALSQNHDKHLNEHGGQIYQTT